MQRVLGRVFLVLLAVLLPAAAIEQTYRIYLFGWAAWSYRRMNSVHDLWTSGLIRAAGNREIAFELLPSRDTYFKLATFRTNAQGLRDVEHALERPPRTVRIAVVGSSFSMPAGVALEDAWHSELERRLDAAAPGRAHEAVNFAVGGYSARQEIAVLKDKVFAYRPQLVLLEFTTHTPYLVYPDAFYTTPYTVEPATHPFWTSFVLQRIRSRMAGIAPDRTPYPDDRLAYMDTIMSQAAALTAGRAVPLCFVILNMHQGNAANARALAQLAQRHARCVVDTTPAFAGIDLAELVIYPTDPHPNPRAHRIFAEVIAPHVERELARMQ